MAREAEREGDPMNAVLRFVDAVNRGDVDGVEAAFHADFEMIVPQQPARGFRGRAQEVENMRLLMASHPEGRIEVRRIVEHGNEIWVQNRYTSAGLEMEAVVIYEIDPATDTILAGHFYSEKVDRGGPAIGDWMEAL
jgi:ketosteroid isomerase-like protein